MTPAKEKARRSTAAPSPAKAPGGLILNSILPLPDDRNSEQAQDFISRKGHLRPEISSDSMAGVDRSLSIGG
jgi:hypothetical protein